MAVIVRAEAPDFNQLIIVLFQAARPINTHTRTHARTHAHKKKRGMRLKSFITTIY